MKHKAFLFDYDGFEREILPILQAALTSDDCTMLIAFIRQHIASLTDPYEGRPLTDDWEKLIETTDAHQYGDFALTKYYDAANDLGLGGAWERIQEIVASDASMDSSPILGSLVGPDQHPFDPGKLGAYFQSKEQVATNAARLRRLAGDKRTDEMNDAIELLEQAVQSDKGLYVTF